MGESKSQPQVFSYEALPELFHTDPHSFLAYLRRDRLNFLRFWWDYVGKNTGQQDTASADGLDFTIKEVENGVTITVITMPEPVNEKGAYFVAMILPQAKTGLFIRRELTRYFTLENKPSADGSSTTTIGEITPRLKHVAISNGPEPTREAFDKSVEDLMASYKI